MIAKPSGPQAQAECDFAPPGGGARQQEVGDVRAGDAEDEPHQRQQDVQRLRIGLAAGRRGRPSLP